jgi:undecaprenyl-diphosphatase
MTETWRAWDTVGLFFFHRAGKEPWDTLMYYATKTWVWIPLFGYWLYLLYRTYPRQVIRWVAFTLLCVLSTDVFCARVLKPWVGRLRPSHEVSLRERLHLVRGYTGGRYGFPSNHAANSAALVVSLGLALRQRRFWLMAVLWGILHSYTRLYLGVHYPSDVLAGWAIGGLMAFALYWIGKQTLLS